MESHLFAEFCEELTRAVNKGLMERRTPIEAWKSELTRIEREMDKLFDALLNETMPQGAIIERSTKLEAQKKERSEFLAHVE